jgi:hypothetical protein
LGNRGLGAVKVGNAFDDGETETRWVENPANPAASCFAAASNDCRKSAGVSARAKLATDNAMVAVAA